MRVVEGRWRLRGAGVTVSFFLLELVIVHAILKGMHAGDLGDLAETKKNAAWSGSQAMWSLTKNVG